jgi:parallel beta-helix repeat protein
MNRKLLSFALLMILLSGLLGAGMVPSRAAGFVVDSNSDNNMAHDKNPGDGLCASWFDECTLRAAIEEANALAGADTITFNSQMTIYLDTAEGTLEIRSQIRLDASSVWDTANNRPGVSLHGGDQSVKGISVYGSNVEIYGLFIYNFVAAISIYSANNTIGGVGQGQRNVLSNNSDNGVYLGASNAHHNVIQGNWIGLSITGDTKGPNRIGVYISSGADYNIIGGQTAATGNYISGNTDHGVVISGDTAEHNRLGGNVIGLPAVGSQDVGNGESGVYIDGAQSTNIGANPMAPNTISQNGGHGVYIFQGWGSKIIKNTISYNTQDGVRVSGASAYGNQIEMNSIHHNGGKGIHLLNGANNGIVAPTITTASASGASGTTCASCVVRIFSDSQDEGETYHDFAVTDGSGNWTYSGALTGPNVTATATSASDNTSEFSTSYNIGSSSGICSSPLTISCGQSVFNDTSGFSNNIGSYACMGWDESGPEVIYSFTLANASDVKAELLSFPAGQDLDLFLLSAGGCTSGQCLAVDSYGDTEASATNVQPGTYYVAVDGYNGSAGAYDLRLTCTSGSKYKAFLPLVLR